jgi:hypothetical protein
MKTLDAATMNNNSPTVDKPAKRPREQYICGRGATV